MMEEREQREVGGRKGSYEGGEGGKREEREEREVEERLIRYEGVERGRREEREVGGRRER